MGSRDPLDVASLSAALQSGSGQRWARVSVVPEVASTNAELLHDGSAPDRSVLVAEYQSAGRGRFDRSWTSPPGAGLTFSVLLQPAVPMARWGWVPLLAGVALAEGVEQAAPGMSLGLKWPNDLLLGEPDADELGKAAGILVQSSADQSSADRLVIGIGLNVSTTREELPVPGATSLQLCGADLAHLSRTSLLASVLARLDARYAQWCDVDGDAEACGLAAAYRALCVTIGRSVVVDAGHGVSGQGVIRGRVIDVDPAGRLVVQDGEQLHTVAAGDVEHVRADDGPEPLP